MNSVIFSRDYLNKQLESATQEHRKFVVLNSINKTNLRSQILLGRDFDLENKTLHYIDSKIACDEIVSRYKQTELNFCYLSTGLAVQPSEEINLMLPESVAFSYIGGSNEESFYTLLTDNHDSFYSCSIKTDRYNFEFVEAWENIFINTILPCTKKLFCSSSYDLINKNLFSKLDRTIYIHSLFHDLGHQVGPWKSTKITKPVSGLKAFEFRVLSELFADTEQILNLAEFTEVPMLIILQKLFWYGKRGFTQNQISGDGSLDSDVWISLYLWKKLLSAGAISKNEDDKLVYNPEEVINVCDEISQELKELYLAHYKNEETFKQAVRKWMASQVSIVNGRLVYDEDYKALLQECADISDNPRLFPTFKIVGR